MTIDYADPDFDAKFAESLRSGMMADPLAEIDRVPGHRFEDPADRIRRQVGAGIAQEAAEARGEHVLEERASAVTRAPVLVEAGAGRVAGLTGSGGALVKLISPGWGTNGYYSEALLKAAATLFSSGTHMYLDHPTRSGHVDRPERTLRDLVGVLEADAKYSSTPAGPGLYARVKIFEKYRAELAELAPHIGVSIRALGGGDPGEAEGRRGRIITQLVEVLSVDFVTAAGRGGHIV